MENEAVITKTARFRLWEDGIIRGIILSEDEHILAHAEENSEAVTKVSNGMRCPLYMDISRCKSVTRDARAHYAKGDAGNRLTACALLVGSYVSKIIGNFFLSISKPIYPTRLFTNEAESIEWLRGFVK